MADRRTRRPGHGNHGSPGRGPGRGRDDRHRPRARADAQESWDPDTATHVRTEGGGLRPPSQRGAPQSDTGQGHGGQAGSGPAGDTTTVRPAVSAGGDSQASRSASAKQVPRSRGLRRQRRSTEERNRRRFARRQWARRWLAWRAVLVAVVLLAALGAGGWVVLASDVLAVEDVEVSGTELLGEHEVRRTAAVPEGGPLARVDLEAIERRVESLAEVRSATVTRAWPHAVAVDVTEREAVAVVEMLGSLRGMDDQGVLFREFAEAPPALPRVVMPSGTSSEAMLEAARVLEALPGSLVPRIDYVEVGSVDAISLVLKGDRRVVWGSAENSKAKAQVAAALLSAVPAAVYDVSVPGQPTTKQTP